MGEKQELPLIPLARNCPGSTFVVDHLGFGLQGPGARIWLKRAVGWEPFRESAKCQAGGLLEGESQFDQDSCGCSCSWSLLGNELHFCLVWFSGKSPLNFFLLLPFKRQPSFGRSFGFVPKMDWTTLLAALLGNCSLLYP